MAKKINTENKLVPLVVRLPPDIHAAVKALSENERRSLNSQIIILVEMGLKQTGVTITPEPASAKSLASFGGIGKTDNPES